MISKSSFSLLKCDSSIRSRRSHLAAKQSGNGACTMKDLNDRSFDFCFLGFSILKKRSNTKKAQRLFLAVQKNKVVEITKGVLINGLSASRVSYGICSHGALANGDVADGKAVTPRPRIGLVIKVLEELCVPFTTGRVFIWRDYGYYSPESF